MAWIEKKAECDWCAKEINGLIDDVYESEKGTLCDVCQKSMIEERSMYLEESKKARISREVSKAIKQATTEVSGESIEEEQSKEAQYVAEFCKECGQELPEGEADEEDGIIK